MSELTIAAPLSGDEIVAAVNDELRRLLQRDCRLNPALAYAAFEAEIWVKVRLKDGAENPAIEADLRMRGGGAGDAPWSESRVVLEDKPPNVVRQRAGLPIPTVVENADGRQEIKNVPYGRPEAKPAEKGKR